MKKIFMMIIVAIMMIKGGWSFDSGNNDAIYSNWSWSYTPNANITSGSSKHSGEPFTEYQERHFRGDLTVNGYFSLTGRLIFDGNITLTGGRIDAGSDFSATTFNISGNAGLRIYNSNITLNRMNINGNSYLTIMNGGSVTIEVLDLTMNGGNMPTLEYTTTSNLIINTIIGNTTPGTYTGGGYYVGRVFATYQNYLDNQLYGVTGARSQLASSTITPVSAIDLSADLTITSALSISKNVTFAGSGGVDRTITLTGGIIESGTDIKYLTLDRSSIDGSYALDTAKYPILKPTLGSDRTLSHVPLRLIDNDGTNGLAAPTEKNVFCPAYCFANATAFYDGYLAKYFNTTNFSIYKLTFNSIYVKPKSSNYDGLEFSNQLIKAGVGSAPGASKIIATNKPNADTKDSVTVSTTRSVGTGDDDGSVTLTRNCTLNVGTYTLTTNGKIDTNGYTITKKSEGIFALHGLAEVITGNLTIDSAASEISPVSMATDASITGILTMKPSAKLVVSDNASVGSIVLASETTPV